MAFIQSEEFIIMILCQTQSAGGVMDGSLATQNERLGVRFLAGQTSNWQSTYSVYRVQPESDIDKSLITVHLKAEEAVLDKYE